MTCQPCCPRPHAAVDEPWPDDTYTCPDCHTTWIWDDAEWRMERSIANGHCPECETFTLHREPDGLPICTVCDWTGWPDDEAPTIRHTFTLTVTVPGDHDNADDVEWWADAAAGACGEYGADATFTLTPPPRPLGEDDTLRFLAGALDGSRLYLHVADMLERAGIVLAYKDAGT